MNETQVKMMEEYGVLVMPEEVNHGAYELVVEALYFANHCGRKDVTLYCAGGGGDLPAGLAIADVIQRHGNVIGLLPGQADSCHALVWLACRERYVYPLGAMGIHGTKWMGSDVPIDERRARNYLHELVSYDGRIVRLLADASNQNLDFWKQTIDGIGGSGFRHFDAVELVVYGIAKRIDALFPAVDEDAVGSVKAVNGSGRTIEKGEMVFLADDDGVMGEPEVVDMRNLFYWTAHVMGDDYVHIVSKSANRTTLCGKPFDSMSHGISPMTCMQCSAIFNDIHPVEIDLERPIDEYFHRNRAYKVGDMVQVISGTQRLGETGYIAKIEFDGRKTLVDVDFPDGSHQFLWHLLGWVSMPD